MKTKKHIFTLLAFLFCLHIFAKDKLITIYDNDCGFCQTLLYDTYQDENVKDKLSNYEHQLFEANSTEGKQFIQNYTITTYPTQIAIINGKKIVLSGFLNTELQLQFLNNPKLFKTQLEIAQSIEILAEQENGFLEQKYIAYICTKINLAKRSDKDPYEAMIDTFDALRIRKKIKINVKKENLVKFAFDNIDKLICENKSTINIREHTTILKYALDSGNYDFLRSAIFVKKDGENICNPHIDFTRVEIIDGEDESLLDFFDKVINHVGSIDFHDLGAVKDIKYKIEACVQSQSNRK